MSPPAAARLRVALLITARDWRGSAAVFAAIARALTGRGHEALALVARPPLEQGFAAAGVPVRRLPIGHTGLAAARALHRALRDFAAGVVVADGRRDLRLAAASSLARRVAIVHALSRPDVPRDLLTRLAYRRVALTVFLTPALAVAAQAAAPYLRGRPQRVIPNGVDAAFFRPDPEAGRAFRARLAVGEGPLLLTVSSLSPEKRLDLLLDAVAGLSAPRPPLAVCGGGGLEGALREQAARLGLDVRWLGPTSAAELVGAYNAATVVVHARPFEPFALSLLEALACGRPLVAPAGGGTPELVGDAGVLVTPGESAALTRALRELLGDPARRAALGARARRRVVERFTLDRMTAEWMTALAALA